MQFSSYGKPNVASYEDIYHAYNEIPARTYVTVVLGPFSGSNRLAATMKPAPSVTFQFNGYQKIFMAVPSTTNGIIQLHWDIIDRNSRFSSYKIYRSTIAGVSTSSTLLSTNTDEEIISYSDSTASPGTKYFYNLYNSFTNGEAFFSNEVSITP